MSRNSLGTNRGFYHYRILKYFVNKINNQDAMTKSNYKLEHENSFIEIQIKEKYGN